MTGTLYCTASAMCLVRWPRNIGSLARRIAPARCATAALNAASNSSGPLALTTIVCRPSARAASCAAVTSASIFGLSGFMKRAIRLAPGAIWRNNSSRFALKVLENSNPGCVASRVAEGVDQSEPGRIRAHGEHDGNLPRSGLRRARRGDITGRRDDCDVAAHQLRCQRRQLIVIALRPAVFDRHILAVDIARLTEAVAES